jgi:hypothetical protein
MTKTPDDDETGAGVPTARAFAPVGQPWGGRQTQPNSRHPAVPFLEVTRFVPRLEKHEQEDCADGLKGAGQKPRRDERPAHVPPAPLRPNAQDQRPAGRRVRWIALLGDYTSIGRISRD